jgi:hypothetical protein
VGENAGGFDDVGLVQSVQAAYVKISGSGDAVDPAHIACIVVFALMSNCLMHSMKVM